MMHPCIEMVHGAIAGASPGISVDGGSEGDGVGMFWISSHLVLERLDLFHNVVEGFVERHLL